VLSGEVSSQFLSALLMVAPMVGGGVEIKVGGELVSKPYVDITLSVMRAFGLPKSCIRRDGYRCFTIKPGSYSAARYDCPPDATAASYFWGAAAVTGSTCVIDGLTRQDIQGDVQFVDALARMGCQVLEFPKGLGVRGLSPRAISADMSAMPDCAQTLAVVCAFAEGTSRLTGLSTLRVKETDRIAALSTELRKLGVVTRFGPDWLEVDGRGDIDVAPAKRAPTIKTYEDHRMAMSFAIAGLRTPLHIGQPEVVSKSFPGFWEYWKQITSPASG
jgi:3-phosphoshikimate 1-carboxyvinyltransferase